MTFTFDQSVNGFRKYIGTLPNDIEKIISYLFSMLPPLLKSYISHETGKIHVFCWLGYIYIQICMEM